MICTWSLHIWWPRPREPQWIITQTCPSASPKHPAATWSWISFDGLDLEEVIAEPRPREQCPGREHHTGHQHPAMPREDEPVSRLLNDLHHRYPSPEDLRPSSALSPRAPWVTPWHS